MERFVYKEKLTSEKLNRLVDAVEGVTEDVGDLSALDSQIKSTDIVGALNKAITLSPNTYDKETIDAKVASARSAADEAKASASSAVQSLAGKQDKIADLEAIRSNAGKIAEAAASAARAESNAAEASESARNSEQYLDDLNEAIKALPDGSAVSAQVALNKTNIESVDGRIPEVEDGEYSMMVVDGDGKIILGLSKADAKWHHMLRNSFDGGIEAPELQRIEDVLANTVRKEDGKTLVDLSFAESVGYTDDAYLYAVVDAEGKYLFCIKDDGTCYIPKIDNPVVTEVKEKLLGDAVELKNVVRASMSGGDEIAVEDMEGYKRLMLDGEGKILSHIDADDESYTEVHETPHQFKKLILGDKTAISGMSDFVAAVKQSGIGGGTGDWSDYLSNDGKKPLYIPEPRLGHLNILCDFDLTKLSKVGRWDAVAGQNYDIKTTVEFWDGAGNYFKKKVLMSGQGNSSMAHDRKSIALDLFDEDWDGDAFAVRFGDWVSQDSFHIKSLYTDFFHGGSYIAYKFADLVETSRGVCERPWQKALVGWDNIKSDQSSKQMSDVALQIDNGALCHPDGFPCVIYQNGEFYGVMIFGLKKHRKNYHMNKSTGTHVHLDGTIDGSTLFGGTIDWTQFEVRNPKKLFLQKDGTAYDADLNCFEIMGDDSPYYTATKDQKACATAKKAIVGLSTRLAEIRGKDASGDTAKAKELLNTYFDVDNLIDYEIVQMVTGDTDGFRKNWQWVTYDGVKWYVCEYDKDMAWGGSFVGSYTTPPSWGIGYMGNDMNTPMGWVVKYYSDKIKERWNELKAAGIISAQRIAAMFKDWMLRIGDDYLSMEAKKWPECPANRDSNINADYWKFTNESTATAWSDAATYNAGNVIVYQQKAYKSLSSGNRGNVPTNAAYWKDVTYSPAKVYQSDEECWYGMQYMCKFLYKGASGSTAPVPITKFYTKYPYELGYHDSFWRLVKYVEERIRLNDNFFNN